MSSAPPSSMHDSLSPGLLIASPKLDGGTFERAVIVMVHHDEEGAMGFIINKKLSVDLASLLESADEELPGEVGEACSGMAVRFGGPVRLEQLWLIYQRKAAAEPARGGFSGQIEALQQRGALRFGDRWWLIADSDSIEQFVYGERDDPHRPFIGYTGWGPGQLEEEIDEGSWLFLDFQDDLIFWEMETEECWDEALKRLGVSPMAFLMMGKAAKA